MIELIFYLSCALSSLSPRKGESRFFAMCAWLLHISLHWISVWIGYWMLLKWYCNWLVLTLVSQLLRTRPRSGLERGDLFCLRPSCHAHSKAAVSSSGHWAFGVTSGEIICGSEKGKSSLIDGDIEWCMQYFESFSAKPLNSKPHKERAINFIIYS
jgi:hypothetical protein